jgi:23S rRNA (guanosine2251-2'-O)-methyltransferase
MRKNPRGNGRESRVESQGSRVKSPRERVENRDSKITNREIGKSHSPLTTDQSPLIFGVLPVLEALRANPRRIEKILVAEGGHEKRLSELFSLARENHIPFQRLPRQNLSKFVEPGTNHQGVMAFVSAASYYESEKLLNEISQKIEAGEKPLVVILDGVEDPRNLGAILRTCECAGITGVFIPERRAVGLTDTAAKSSAGATEYVKVAKVTNLNNLIEDLKKRRIWVVGTSVETSQNYSDWDWDQPTALVMGSEGKGLHRLVAENCDALIKIPMQGKIESLNVSVATGVILFEAIRQRVERQK